MTLFRRRCGFCNGVLSTRERSCPYCNQSLESYGALGDALARLLPRDRPMTRVLLFATVAVFAMVSLLAGGTSFLAPSVYTSIRFGASFGPYIAEGQWWRLLTAIFLHGGIIHLGFNMYALWTVGPLIENTFGKLRFLIIYFLTGLASTAMTLGWNFIGPEIYALIPFLDPNDARAFMVPLVGASGALTGFLGVGVAAGHKAKTSQGLMIRNLMLRWMFFILIFGLVVPNVGNVAHIAGFLVGLPLGWLLHPRDRAGFKMGLVYAGTATLMAGIMVASIVLQGMSIPLQYKHDFEGYPTGIFGVTLRENTLESNKALEGVRQACLGALDDLDKPLSDKDRSLALTRATTNCDELAYTIPLNPGFLFTSALAHVQAGDTDFACKRLHATKLATLYSKSYDLNTRQALVSEIEQSAKRAKCPTDP